MALGSRFYIDLTPRDRDKRRKEEDKYKRGQTGRRDTKERARGRSRGHDEKREGRGEERGARERAEEGRGEGRDGERREGEPNDIISINNILFYILIIYIIK